MIRKKKLVFSDDQVSWIGTAISDLHKWERHLLATLEISVPYINDPTFTKKMNALKSSYDDVKKHLETIKKV